MKGTFIMVDGILGSGKSTILNALHDWAEACEHRIFSMRDWQEDIPPAFSDLPDMDVLFTYEPTRTWIGRALRYELSRTDEPYSGRSQAHAFALDREIQYRRLILPALAAGKTVIQDRGVTSSIVIQPTISNDIEVEELIQLPGNALALEHAPTHLILTHVDAATAFNRIQSRSEESKGVYALKDSLVQQEERFKADWFRQLMAKHGTTIHEIDTSQTLEETQQAATTLVNSIFTSC